MNKAIFTLMIAGIATTLYSCSGNKTQGSETDSIQSSQVSETQVNDMNEYNLDGTIEVAGVKYNYEFAFRNAPELAVVTTPEGFRYHDNKVKLIITRGNETTFEHTFTKETFKTLIPAKDYKQSVLAGFNFNYMQQDKHDRFYFIAVVGNPDETSDMSYSVAINIDRSGNIQTAIVHTVDTEPINNNLNQDPGMNDA